MTKFRVNLLQLVVLAETVSLVQCELKLLLIHTNDMHSRFQETNANSGQCVKGRDKKCYGGFARLKTAVDQSRQKAKAKGYSSIFLDAGDSYQGSIFYTMIKSKIVSEFDTMLGIDVMSLGNHEFDDGPEGLAPFLDNSTTPIVCCNIDISKEPKLKKLAKSHILDVNGNKVGVVGYLTPDTKFLSHTGEDVTFVDEISAIKAEVEKLKKDGVKILIALGHSGYPMDKKIAKEVPDLDIVVGGHTHSFLYSGKAPSVEAIEGPYPTVVTQASGRKVYVVTAYAYTKYLGNLFLTLDDNGEVVKAEGSPILIDESFKKDGEVENLVQKYEKQIKKMAGKRVGKSKTFLEADEKICRVRECNFGNLITDAIVDMNAQDFNGQGWTDAPVAFVQGGSLRASIDTNLNGGQITLGDLMTTMPYWNSIVCLVISGEVLRKVMEHSVEHYDPENRPGAYMQYSGVHVRYDLTKSPGQRVVSAMVRCGNCTVPQYFPLENEKQYQVLTNEFLADGGDDYKMLKEVSERKVLSFSDVNAVSNYLKMKSPVHPEIQDRIINAASTFYHTVFTSLLCLTTLKISTEYLLD